MSDESPSDFGALLSTGMGWGTWSAMSRQGARFWVVSGARGFRNPVEVFCGLSLTSPKAAPTRGLACEAHVTLSLLEATFLEGTEKQVKLTCFATREPTAFSRRRLVNVRDSGGGSCSSTLSPGDPECVSAHGTSQRPAGRGQWPSKLRAD